MITFELIQTPSPDFQIKELACSWTDHKYETSISKPWPGTHRHPVRTWGKSAWMASLNLACVHSSFCQSHGKMFTMIIVLLGPCRCHCPANKFLAAACLLSFKLNPLASLHPGTHPGSHPTSPCHVVCPVFGQGLLAVVRACFVQFQSPVPYVVAWLCSGRIIYFSNYSCS